MTYEELNAEETKNLNEKKNINNTTDESVNYHIVTENSELKSTESKTPTTSLSYNVVSTQKELNREMRKVLREKKDATNETKNYINVADDTDPDSTTIQPPNMTHQLSLIRQRTHAESKTNTTDITTVSSLIKNSANTNKTPKITLANETQKIYLEPKEQLPNAVKKIASNLSTVESKTSSLQLTTAVFFDGSQDKSSPKLFNNSETNDETKNTDENLFTQTTTNYKHPESTSLKTETYNTSVKITKSKSSSTGVLLIKNTSETPFVSTTSFNYSKATQIGFERNVSTTKTNFKTFEITGKKTTPYLAQDTSKEHKTTNKDNNTISEPFKKTSKNYETTSRSSKTITENYDTTSRNHETTIKTYNTTNKNDETTIKTYNKTNKKHETASNQFEKSVFRFNTYNHVGLTTATIEKENQRPKIPAENKNSTKSLVGRTKILPKTTESYSILKTNYTNGKLFTYNQTASTIKNETRITLSGLLELLKFVKIYRTKTKFLVL